MRVEKTMLAQLESCYAVNELEMDGKRWLLAGSEAKAPAYAFNMADLSERRTLWTEPGGVMTFVPLKSRSGEFLIIRKFYSLFNWEQAEVAWCWSEKGEICQKTLAVIPYIHRIDVFETGEGLYFLGCSVSQRKTELADWSVGGTVQVGRLVPEDRSLCQLRVLRDDLFQNHGYCRAAADWGLIGCREGVFRVEPPKSGADWHLEKIMDRAVSDMALCDIDGDGRPELAAIEPFHGCRFRVYRQTEKGWEQIYEHPEVTEFYHVVWGGLFNGRPMFLGGCRRGKQQLFALHWEDGSLKPTVLEEGVGPSNIHVFTQNGRQRILSSNRESGHTAVYDLWEE